MCAAVPEGEAVVSDEADAEGDGKGDEVCAQRRHVRAFDGKRQHGEMYGGGGRADEEEVAALFGAVGGAHGLAGSGGACQMGFCALP